jgi:hypothetical protein
MTANGTLERQVGGLVDALLDEGSSDLEVRERLAEIELALEDQGWRQLTAQGHLDLSSGGRQRVRELARLMFRTHPLIRHAVRVQAHYVWGQGVNVRARHGKINEVVQAWWDHPGNQRELTAHDARMRKEIGLQNEGGVFLALFTLPDTGFVRVRTIDVDQIRDVIANPDDSHEPWYYQRCWVPQSFDPQTGVTQPAQERIAYHPDWRHPLLLAKNRPLKIRDQAVAWDAPVYHLQPTALDGEMFAMPETYSALDWARAVRQDLQDYATKQRALARFAFQLKRKGGPAAVTAARKRLQSTLTTDDTETNPAPATGSTFIAGEGADLQPIRTAGATPSPDEGRRLWLMVAAGTGIPEAMLSGDASLGSWATAKTLDRPTELEMRTRQETWRGAISDLIGYVIDAAALAPKGPLSGRLIKDPYTREQRVEVGPEDEPYDRRIDVDFPNILEKDVQTRVQAITTAATLNGQANANTLRPETLTRLLLSELLEDDIDEELAEMRVAGAFEDEEESDEPAVEPPPAPAAPAPATNPPPAPPAPPGAQE